MCYRCPVPWSTLYNSMLCFLEEIFNQYFFKNVFLFLFFCFLFSQYFLMSILQKLKFKMDVMVYVCNPSTFGV
jgi:hypothetical protein